WSANGPESAYEPFATYLNTGLNTAVSTTLTNQTWNNTTVLPGDTDAIRRLKDSVDGDIAMSGSATTVRWLLAHGLLDALHLLVHPIAVGHGQRLFEDTRTPRFNLIRSETLTPGVLYLVYAPTP